MRTDTKENIKAIMRKIDLFASDGPKRVITKNDLTAAIVQGAGVTHYQRKRDYIDALQAFGFILQANKTAYYFLEDAWQAHELFAEITEDVKTEIIIKEAVR